MRAFHSLSVVLLLPATLLLTTTPAAAQSNAYPVTDVPAMSTVQVTPPAGALRVTDADLDEVSGTYAMSNGWRLKVEPGSSGIVARIDRQRPMRLIALSPDRYVSRDGNVSMDFNTKGDVNEITMSYIPADSLTAQRVVLTSRLAQR